MTHVEQAAVPGCAQCGRLKVKVAQDNGDVLHAARVAMSRSYRVAILKARDELRRAHEHLRSTRAGFAEHLRTEHDIDLGGGA